MPGQEGSHFRRTEKAPDRVSQCGRRVGWHEQAVLSLANELRVGAAIGRDHWSPGQHGLRCDQSEGLKSARKNEGAGVAHVGGKGAAIQVTGEMDPLRGPGARKFANRARNIASIPWNAAGENQMGGGKFGQHASC